MSFLTELSRIAPRYYIECCSAAGSEPSCAHKQTWNFAHNMFNREFLPLAHDWPAIKDEVCEKWRRSFLFITARRLEKPGASEGTLPSRASLLILLSETVVDDDVR